MTSAVVVFSDNLRLVGELATAAASLAGPTGRVCIVEVDLVRDGVRGGDVVLARAGAGGSPISGNPELISNALSTVLATKPAPVVLIGSTKVGRAVAGLLAVAAKRPVIADVRELRFDGANLDGARPAFAGKFVAAVRSPLPCIALVPQGVYDPSTGPSGTVEEVQVPQPAPPRVKVLETRETEKSSTDLRTAKVIVSAGRGFRKKEDLALAERLAKALGGALGASRPLSSDLGWLGEEYHIGLTGVYVHPDLYVAVGISGQLQHVAGIRDSKLIVAINKDKQAPIFLVSDYGVVGDLYEVVPAILKELGAT